jgi:hypothetical protein
MLSIYLYIVLYCLSNILGNALVTISLFLKLTVHSTYTEKSQRNELIKLYIYKDVYRYILDIYNIYKYSKLTDSREDIISYLFTLFISNYVTMCSLVHILCYLLFPPFICAPPRELLE